MRIDTLSGISRSEFRLPRRMMMTMMMATVRSAVQLQYAERENGKMEISD